jgi:hypothetical protein
MLRLVSFCCIIFVLVMVTGCKMCASHADITGSPIANGMSGDGSRAGSYFGGYSGGGFYADGYPSSASPRRVYNTEFSTPPSPGAKTIQSTPSTTMQYAPNRNVMQANYYSASAPVARY